MTISDYLGRVIQIVDDHSSGWITRYSVLSLTPMARRPLPDDYHVGALPAGTLLHKGFYDLLTMIPTPLFQWRPLPPRKNKRISKDMVSNPTGFLCVLSR